MTLLLDSQAIKGGGGGENINIFCTYKRSSKVWLSKVVNVRFILLPHVAFHLVKSVSNLARDALRLLSLAPDEPSFLQNEF
jgi:hypothetical protein